MRTWTKSFARTRTTSPVAAVLLGALLLAPQPAGAQPDAGTPLLEFTFEDGFSNLGAAGGMAEVETYAEGEGPYLMPGPWGDCLDLTDASRLGGTLEQTDPAGSALMFADNRLDAIESFTVTLWYRVPQEARGVNARILNKGNSWEVLYGNGRLALLTAEGTTKFSHSFPRPPVSSAAAWTFLAAVVDTAARQAQLYVGDRRSGLGDPPAAAEAVAVQELKHAPPPVASALEIGNFRGIRPFDGWLDNLRIYDYAMTEAQVSELFASDVRALSASRERSALTTVPPAPRRFRPRGSDIFFRTMSQERLSKLNGFDLLRSYHVTHLLWVYGNKPEVIEQVHEMGIFYQGTLNGLIGYQEATPERSAEGDMTGRQRDLDGNKVVLPHMAKWNPEHPRWTGCHNSPAFRKLFWQEADGLVNAGVDALHVDDWMATYSTARNGLGCFCPDCMAGFRAYLQRAVAAQELAELGLGDLTTFDYAAYLRQHEGIDSAEEYRARFRDLKLTPYFLDLQRRTLREFYGELRRHLDEASPDRYLPVSVNNQFYRRGPEDAFGGHFMVDLLDFFAGEASKTMQTANHYVMPCKVAEGLGIPQVMMSKPGPVAASQAALATSYALGQWFRVPWDLYMDITPDGQAAPRYFGAAEDWGPLYDFIHDHPDLFSDYETAANVGVLVNADAGPYGPVWDTCQWLAERQIQFRLIVAADGLVRVALRAEELDSVRFVLQLSPDDSFCEQDRQVIEHARRSRRIRFLTSKERLSEVLDQLGQLPIRVEGPRDIYAFVRVQPEGSPPPAVIHMVNWNMLPDGSRADAFRHVSLSLRSPGLWGEAVKVKYYRPGDTEPTAIEPELHSEYLRIVLPTLETWGIVELAPLEAAAGPSGEG